MSNEYKYLFGPVPSRRLGRSLGIDVTPAKTCSFDCIFCQCGRTEEKTTKRSDLVPFEEVCAEIERWTTEDGEADVITFAGSGEPTLYSRLGDLINFIKEKTDLPLIVLSNGTMLSDSDVRKELAKVDVVKISLSAWNCESLEKVNRPASSVSVERSVSGAIEFRKSFKGKLWLEVFLMDGINSDEDQVRKIAEKVKLINPDRIQLNTAVRPCSEGFVKPVSPERLLELCTLFGGKAEVIASFKTAVAGSKNNVSAEKLFSLVHRHPATATQLADVLGADENLIKAKLESLVKEKNIQIELRNGQTWYK